MIRLSRGNFYVDKLRAYKIYIDDVYCGDIKDGEVKDFAAPSGKHTVYAKIDWCTSNKLDVVVSDGVLELEVSPSLRREKVMVPFIEFYYVIFKKNEYLLLKEKAAAGGDVY